MTRGFGGIGVTSFESRRREEMKKLISYHGGVPTVAPSMRELPDFESPEVPEFAESLFAGAVDMLILMTGVGTRILSDMVVKSSGEKNSRTPCAPPRFSPGVPSPWRRFARSVSGRT